MQNQKARSRTQGISSLVIVVVVFALIIVILAGVLAWQNFSTPKQETANTTATPTPVSTITPTPSSIPTNKTMQSEIEIIAPVKISNFDVKNNFFNAEIFSGKKIIKVQVVNTTKFYSTCGNKIHNFDDFYNLNKNWVGYAWLYTVKGVLNSDETSIIADEIDCIGQ
jgi:hypothetical protein